LVGASSKAVPYNVDVRSTLHRPAGRRDMKQQRGLTHNKLKSTSNEAAALIGH
jgi:hypothetical protein